MYHIHGYNDKNTMNANFLVASKVIKPMVELMERTEFVVVQHKDKSHVC